jgi:hippurate hydrolase
MDINKIKELLVRVMSIDINKATEFRHLMHQYPEGELQEFETQKRIKDYLLSIGIDEMNIKICAKTGLYVDIIGTKPKEEGTVSKCIALRADIDGLKMQENNPLLEYRSKTAYAHMCGHDGHTATLLLTAQILWSNRDKFNGTVRLLFQPAEEGPGGALPMV